MVNYCIWCGKEIIGSDIDNGCPIEYCSYDCYKDDLNSMDEFDEVD